MKYTSLHKQKKNFSFCIYNSFSAQTIVISTAVGKNITTSTRHNEQSALVNHHTYFAAFTGRYIESNIYNMFIIPQTETSRKQEGTYVCRNTVSVMCTLSKFK